MIKMYFFPETSNWHNVQNFSNEEAEGTFFFYFY